MRYLKNIGVAALAALSIATASVATSSSASAQRGFHGGWHGGWHGGGWGRGAGWGPAIAGGVALGALATSPYWYSAPVAGYYDDCFPRRRIVGYTAWGRPIVRVVRACY
jgi:hypothetical protein